MTALALTLDYVAQRKAFGATLYDKQVIRQRLAMLAGQDRSGAPVPLPLRLVGDSGARLRARGVDAQGAHRRNGERSLYTCQQFHGGMGYMRETAIERLTRDARVLAIGGGATEVMLEEVAKRS